MAGLHDLKKQINSTKNMQQITNAMRLVAASKLRRAQEAATGARPYADGIKGLLHHLVESGVKFDDPLLVQGNKELPIGYIFITADRGLCGGYNANVIRAFAADISEVRAQGRGVKVITVGKKGRDYCRHSGIDVVAEYSFDDNIGYQEALIIANVARQLFLSGSVSEVKVVYTKFLSTVAHKPEISTLIPVTADSVNEDADRDIIGRIEYLLEPSAKDLLNLLLPKYITTEVQSALYDSKASQQGATMMAMGAATDNAEEIIQNLSLKFNRERQAAITREISEIVGGANALK